MVGRLEKFRTFFGFDRNGPILVDNPRLLQMLKQGRAAISIVDPAGAAVGNMELSGVDTRGIYKDDEFYSPVNVNFVT